MARELNIVVYGEPIPQPRHQIGRQEFRDKKTGQMRTFITRSLPKTADGSPHPVIAWKRCIESAIQEAMRGGFDMIKRPNGAGLGLLFFFLRPKSKPKKEGMIHTVRPDLDNLLKAVKDAMKGVILEDDSQINQYLEPFKKEYTLDNPRLEIRLVENIPDPIQGTFVPRVQVVEQPLPGVFAITSKAR